MWHILLYDSFPWTKRREEEWKHIQKMFCQYLRQSSGSSWTPQCGYTHESWAGVICGAHLAHHCPPRHHHFLRYLCDYFLLHCCHCHRVSVCWHPPHRHLGGRVASFWTWPARRSAHLQSHTSNYQSLCIRKLSLWYNPRNLWRCMVLFINCERSMLYAQAGIYGTCGLAVIIAILIQEADSIFIASIFIIAFSLTHPVFFFTLTFLPAVTSVPLFIKLWETNITGVGLERLPQGRRWWSLSSFTWCFLPFLSTQPHCRIGTQTLPFCTKPSLHTHLGLHASFWLQSGGPFRCVHVGVHAGTQGE